MKSVSYSRGGLATRARLLETAQHTFKERGYHRASQAVLMAFYRHVAEHRALYQIFREAEFVRLSLPIGFYHRLAGDCRQA